MYDGILCDLCGERIPGATIDALVKVTRGDTVHVSEVKGLEVCALCPIGTSRLKNGSTVEVMRVTNAHMHSNPLEK